MIQPNAYLISGHAIHGDVSTSWTTCIKPTTTVTATNNFTILGCQGCCRKRHGQRVECKYLHDICFVIFLPCSHHITVVRTHTNRHPNTHAHKHEYDQPFILFCRFNPRTTENASLKPHTLFLNPRSFRRKEMMRTRIHLWDPAPVHTFHDM